MTSTVETPGTALGAGWWARGLNLVERRGPGQEMPDLPPDHDADRLRRRLERWRTAYGDADGFGRRLSDAGLDEPGLLALLGEVPADLAARTCAPSWADDVREAVAEADAPADDHEPADEADEADDTRQAYTGFARIIAPFVRLALRRCAAAGAFADVDPAAVTDQLGHRISRTLVRIAARTLVLELNVLRVTDRLAGSTPHERFASFVAHYRRPEHLAGLFAEYPVLARLLAQAAAQAADAHVEFLRRYARDRSALVRVLLDGTDPGPLVGVEASGDGHRGRAVAVLRFAGGARVVYKPRPLSVHRHFNDVVGWLNDRLPGLDLRTLRLVERDGYGWIEFAEHRPCPDAGAVARYYRRQGALLALLYALDGADFHVENVIACADQPVLVDLEALMHPELRSTAPGWAVADPARDTLLASVDRVALLPRLMIGENGALDLSGLGGDRGATLPQPQVSWADPGTDGMALTRVSASFPGGQNRPRLGDADADPVAYADELIAGFGAAYDAVAAHRSDLIGAGGLLWRFSDDEVRVIVRPTRLYFHLLDESTHPDVLRDALDRDRILDYVWAASVGDAVRERLFPYEISELWSGDVPIFTSRPSLTTVWTGSGTRLPGVLVEPSLVHAARKIRGLGARDRERQVWVIRAAFAVRDREDADPAASPEPWTDGAATEVDPDRLVAAAAAVAAEIEHHGCADARRVNWLGLDLVEARYWTLAPLGFDLFGGYPGVALFLAQLAAVTREQRYADLARRAVWPVPDLVDSLVRKRVPVKVGLGAYNGPAGLAYALVHLAALLDDATVAAPVAQLVELCRDAFADADADQLDVIGGSAGTVAAMLAIHEATGLPAAAGLARACAGRLVERAEPAGDGVAWRVPMTTDAHLTGFAHGAGGIAWALARYAAATGDRRYARLAADGFAYERTRYAPELRDWLDLRDGAPEAGRPPRAMHSWCNGAPGIGLARADALRRCAAAGWPDLGFGDDLDLAIGSMRAAGRIGNHSLCHGELGNLELLTAAAALGREDAAGWRAQRTATALTHAERGGLRCGTPGAVGTPGLLTGHAGIGHGLLRLAMPERIPAVLLLEPPRAG